MRTLTRKAEQLGFVCMAFALLLCAVNANADVIEKEDLSACKLPCDERELPSNDTRAGARGYIYRFSDKGFSKDPFAAEGKRPQSIKALFQRLRRENVGDLWYSSAGGNSFVAVSGRIADLGEHYLFEFSNKALPRPKIVFSATERSGKTGEAYPGVLEGVKVGHCYLVETTDGKYVLVRLITMDKGERSATIQYVYQPDGRRTFTIPKGKIITTETRDRPPIEAPAPTVRQPEPRTGQTLPDIDTHLEHRTKLILRLIAMVKRRAQTGKQIRAKAKAISTLGRLRVGEAAATLVSEVAFKNPFAISRELSVVTFCPCVPALINIGKPGTNAALEAMDKVRFDKNQPGAALEAKRTIYLLVYVIKGVEGKDVAEFIIKREMGKGDEAHKATYQLALKCLSELN